MARKPQNVDLNQLLYNFKAHDLVVLCFQEQAKNKRMQFQDKLENYMTVNGYK